MKSPNHTTPLSIGVAMTGAKYTPANHAGTNDPKLDPILRGDDVPTDPQDLLREAKLLHEIGVRYFHIHARNPHTREQSCDAQLYRLIGKMLRNWNPELILSYGASRNGREIRKAIQDGCEWSRLRHVGLTREEGGADFVTIQAAAELKIIMDLQKQGFVQYTNNDPRSFSILRDLREYRPDQAVEEIAVEAHSTSGGADYGSTSAGIQFEAFRSAMEARGELHLPQEVEWTQLVRSYATTKLALENFAPGLGNTGRLNITILFGFSPLLPFPTTYEAFRTAVDLATSLRRPGCIPPLHLTVTVGAAVMPQHAVRNTLPLDVGPRAGEIVSPLERLIAYSCMPESGVDALRFGLEDAPYLMGNDGEILRATNLDIAKFVFEKLPLYGGEAVTDPVKLRHFVSTEMRAL